MNTLALIRALAFLQSRSLWNALKVRVRRLKQPKYLIGAVVGLGYMYLWFGRHLLKGMGGGRNGAPEVAEEIYPVIAAAATLVLFLFVAGMWIFTGSRASLQFSEAELAFLLPAPLTRRMLVRYKLIRAQLGTLLSALFFTLFSGRLARDGHAVFHLLGWWLVLTTLNLHGIGASFTVQRLSERGLASWLRRVLATAVVLLIIGTVGLWLWTLPPPFTQMPDGQEAVVRALGEWLQQAMTSGPGPWLLAPFRWLVQPWFAASVGEFVLAVLPVLGLIAAHYWWVERCDVSFEEASLEVARKRADLVAAARSGKNPLTERPVKRTQPLFALAATGFAAVALTWKGLIQFRASRGALLVAGAFVLAAAVGVRVWNLPEPLWNVLWTITAMGAGMLLLFGGAITSTVFRRDLGMLDVLKGYPLPGWQIVLGELLGPALWVAAWQALLGLLLFLCVPAGERVFPVAPPMLFVGWLSLLPALPLINVMNAAIPSAATLLFPAWAKPGRDIEQPGFEAMGQRLLLGIGQVAVMAVTWLPAVALTGGVFLLANWLTGPWFALPAAGLTAAVVFGAVAFGGVRLLGMLFDRFDASAEQ